jgi:hypothetical protein
MKLRIKGDSLRLRIGPAEVKRLIETGRIAETIHFTSAPEASLTYALETATQVETITVRHTSCEVAVLLPAAQARAWFEGPQVGLYGHAPIAGGMLEIAVEKDFACLDKNIVENEDTYPNPLEGAVC